MTTVTRPAESATTRSVNAARAPDCHSWRPQRGPERSVHDRGRPHHPAAIGSRPTKGTAMTTETTTTRMDDLTGEPAATRIVFGLDNHVYEIDLADTNEAALRAALAPYINVSTVIGGIRTRAAGSRSGADLTGRPVAGHERIRKAMSDAFQ